MLNPFITNPCRAPSDFYLATGLMDYKFEYDWTPGNTVGKIIIFPWFFGAQIKVDSPSWVNFYTT
jgi:hypothetical protein